MCIKINKIGKQEVGIWWVQKRFPRYGVPIWSLRPNIRSLPSIVAEKNVTKNEHICSMCIKINKVDKQEVGIRWVQKRFPRYGVPIMKLVTKYQISAINSCWEKCDEKCAYMFNVYKNQLSRQTGSRNLMGQKTLPTIWGTYMTLVTKYQISVINSCWEKCDEKCAYMFNVYKDQLSRQTGSRNLTGPTFFFKRYPQYGIPIWCLWPNIRFLPSTVTKKNATKNILDGRKDGRTEVKQYTPLPLRGAGV